MVQKSDGRVSLSLGNWLTLIGMLVGWTLAVGAFIVHQENRLTRQEMAIEYLVEKIERLTLIVERKP